jgi:NitT/TauT family transport system permease protein
MKEQITFNNIAFLVLLGLGVSDIEGESYFLGAVLFFKLLQAAASLKKSRRRQSGDVAGFVFAGMIIWELLTAKFNILDSFLFPAPNKIIALFLDELPSMLSGLAGSLYLLGTGYGLALVLSVGAGLVVGYNRRLHDAVQPVSKILSAIPPIVYIPYAIALLPAFQWASVLVIFIGAFWPIFVSALNGVLHVDKNIIDSARMLHIKGWRMLFRIILPSIVPELMTGCSVGLIFSFILLTSAEMIGATSGIGWYVKYYSDFGDYDRVIVGILFIGLVVTAVMGIFDYIQKYLLRWRANDK